jgi:hypothetical protein
MNHCFWHDPEYPYLVLFGPGTKKGIGSVTLSFPFFQKTKKRKDESSSSSSEEEDEEDMELLRSEPPS